MSTVWEEVPFLVEYAKNNPPPQAPKRICTSRYPFVPTKAYRAFMEVEQEWELDALRAFREHLVAKAQEEQVLVMK